MKPTIKETERFSLHLILYAKHWYNGHFLNYENEKTDDERDESYLNDLKIIIGKWSLCEPTCISTREVLVIISHLWQQFALMDADKHNSVSNYMAELFFTMNFSNKESVKPIDAIYRMMGQLSIISKDKLPDLPEPDASILPLTVHFSDEAPFDSYYSKVCENKPDEFIDIIEESCAFIGTYTSNDAVEGNKEIDCFWLCYCVVEDDEAVYYVRLKHTKSIWKIDAMDKEFDISLFQQDDVE